MIGLVAIWGIAGILAILAARRGLLRQGAVMSFERFLEVLPRVGLALLAAGFLSHLVPSGPIAHVIGPESGFSGMVIAALVGGFIPSGPIVSFPVVVVLTQAGAGFPQVVAFVTAWSVLAFHRVLIYEITLMGWRFSAVRLASSVLMPLVAGLLALGLQTLFPIKWPPF